MSYPVVRVQWTDSRGCQANWTELEDYDPKPCIMTSVGYLVIDNDDYIMLVPHLGEDPLQGCGDMTIPRVCVTDISPLKLKQTNRCL